MAYADTVETDDDRSSGSAGDVGMAGRLPASRARGSHKRAAIRRCSCLYIGKPCEFTRRHPQFFILLAWAYPASRPTGVIPRLLKDKAQVRLMMGNSIVFDALSVTRKGPSEC